MAEEPEGEPEVYYSVIQAARKKGVDRETVRRAIRRGSLRAITSAREDGGSVLRSLIPAPALDAWHPTALGPRRTASVDTEEGRLHQVETAQGYSD